MRTATTWGKKHKGDWENIASPAVPLMEQKQAIKKLLGSPHKEYCEIHYQENDCPAIVYKFKSLEAHAEHESRRAVDHKQFLAANSPSPTTEGEKKEAKKKEAK